VLSWRLHASGTLRAASGPGFAAGIVAALGVLALSAHALPKRAIRFWMKRREDASAARAPSRSRLRVLVLAHLGLGLVTMAAVLAHAGTRVPVSSGGALAVAFWLTSLLGAAGAVAYRHLPRILARLERRAVLPEDLRGERRALLERLESTLSGRDALVKTIADKIVLPYAAKPGGALLLVVAGRTLREEEHALRARIDALLDGRGGARLQGLDDVVRLAVELRALPARRLVEWLLRGWAPLHAALAALLLALLVVHALGAIGW
jgi:hypothetical protein